MKLIKAILLMAAMLLSSAAWAVTDDEHVEISNAIERGHIDIVKKYVDAGLAINEPVFGWSWLHVAVNRGQMDISKLLVEHGSNLNYRHPITKMTPLALAAANNNKDLVEYLLAKGADPNIKLRADVSLVRMTRDMGFAGISEYLLQHGALDDGCKEEECF